MESDDVDFSCRVCGVQCNVAPPLPDRAVCEEHCEDHEYEYDPMRRGKFCNHCDKEREPEYFEDDVVVSFARESGEQLGTPLSELSGRPGRHGFQKFSQIASSWGYE